MQWPSTASARSCISAPPRSPWKALLAEVRRKSDAPKLDPRREPIPTIEAFAAACGVEFRPEWGRDLDAEIASIEVAPDAPDVLRRLRATGFRLALASNLAPAYVPAVERLLGDQVDVTCFSCDPDIRAVKPEPKFFEALQTRLGLPASRILMVGDSLGSDIRGAAAAGMPTLQLALSMAVPTPGRIRSLSEVPVLLREAEGHERMRRRAARANVDAALHIPNRVVPDVPPDEEDE
ncbi:HAD family hydrolase [Sinirhodobacter populi]|uniref:phosphoglycolate phosphatase n=1 Tax=Paenirhodobacter populi TaxID=2306993 RepID=A0A443J8J1_9RHOB|nr:HAD family hydrolase [Sinirhodobacter populi]